MNVRIFWVRAMKCMCAQTRPRFILSSERVFGGMEFEPMLTLREKSPLLENFPTGGSNPRRCGQWAQTLPTSYSSPGLLIWLSLDLNHWPQHSNQMLEPPGHWCHHGYNVTGCDNKVCLFHSQILQYAWHWQNNPRLSKTKLVFWFF